MGENDLKSQENDNLMQELNTMQCIDSTDKEDKVLQH